MATEKDTKHTSYLDSISFDPALRNRWWAKYITNIRWVLLLILSVIVVGVSSFVSLPTRLNPEISIPIVTVVTTLPGAGPQDVETLITEPLEEELASVKGINTMTSSSRENFSVITLEFSSSIDSDKARQDAQAAVDTVTGLPEDASSPRVAALDFEDVPVWTFALSSKSSFPSLLGFAENLENKIEALPKVDRVEIIGTEQEEIQVIIKPEKLQEYKINPASLAQSVSAATSSFPAGSLDTSTSSFSLSIDPQVVTVQDIRNLRININGSVQNLGDIAEVSERSKDGQAPAFIANGQQKAQRAITVAVYKVSSANIDDTEKEVHDLVDEALKPYGDQFILTTVSNTAEDITEQFAELMANFRDTIILVSIVLIAFLGFRQAIIACFTIPLTFLAAFGFMQAFDLTINFLTLFSLLLSLGLLIDDTVVVVQAMTSYDHTKKFAPQESGILVWRDFIVPIWSTTITTVWAFAPLLLASGIIGEFIKSIPIVVSVTLLSSTAIAVLVTLPLMIFALKPAIPQRVKNFFTMIMLAVLLGVLIALSPKNAVLPFIILAFILLLIVIKTTYSIFRDRLGGWFNKHPKLKKNLGVLNHKFQFGFIDMGPIDNKYKQAIASIIGSKARRNTVLIIVVIFSLFSYMLVPFGFVQNEFFPKSDADVIYVNFELSSGTKVDEVTTRSQGLVEKLRVIPEVEYVTAEIGRGADSTGFSGGGNTALFTLNLHKDRERSSIELSNDIRKEFANYPDGDISVIEESGGPPAGSDIQIKLLGEDLATLDEYANKIMAHLEGTEGVINVEKSLKPGTSKIVFIPDYDKLAEMNISTAQLGQQLRMFASGFTLDTLTINDTEKDIVFRMDGNIQTPEAISALTIQAPGEEQPVPLTSLGRLELRTNPTQINREERKRTISVSAGVSAGYNGPAINAELEKFAKEELNLPSGYEWRTGGVNEENAKSVQSILQAMVLAFILIFGTMVLQFGSFRQAFIVLLVIPLAISGVFIVFALTGTPLSFPALIGVLALFGIVVNNSMMIIDKINQNLKEGLNFRDSIADAAGSRLEPILLTSLLTTIGLVPITLSDPLWQGLGGAIIAGLLFSGAIMLFFIPVVYYLWFRGDFEPVKKA